MLSIQVLQALSHNPNIHGSPSLFQIATAFVISGSALWVANFMDIYVIFQLDV